MSNQKFLLLLAILYLPIWVGLAIDPNHRSDWLLENVLVVIAIILIASTYRGFPLSRISYLLIFLFLSLHTVGAHYTYAEVPYRDWLELIGYSADNESRNHFDRLVHFFYGLLIAYPIRELFIRIATVRGFWGYFLPLEFTMATSMLYELVEWGAAMIFGGELGMAFLGTQGDIWDAHKDMALASLGALITMSFTAMLNRGIQRDFAEEWNESLRVKGKHPLGEEEIIRLTENNSPN